MGRIMCKMQCVPSPSSLKSSEALSEKYGGLRRFYDCSVKYNDVVSYVEHGSRLDFGLYEEFNGGVKIGIFDSDGICDSEKLNEYQEKLRKTDSPIWAGIILFPEEFGLEYVKTGYDEKGLKDFFLNFKDAGEEKTRGLQGHENYVRHIHFVYGKRFL